MKKLFLILYLMCVMPSFALCPVENGESVCSIGDFKNNTTSIIQNTYSESNMNNFQKTLQPLQKENLYDKTRIPNSELMKYDSGCQFGTCVQNLKENLPSK